MVQVLTNYLMTSAGMLYPRPLDGMRALDVAATQLRTEWHTNEPARFEPCIATLLDACVAWLADPTRHGFARREVSIRTLYWQVAWAYLCKLYAWHAWDRLEPNNDAHVTTSAVALPLPPKGSPYHFPGTPYLREVHPLVYRGDTRGPVAIRASNGFQPKNLASRHNYGPWFDGHATGDTISMTNSDRLAINATGAAKATGAARQREGGTNEGEVPAWLNQLVPSRKGWVYEVAPGPGIEAIVLGNERRELVYLAIPVQRVVRWWAVLQNNTTFGPFTYADIDNGGPLGVPMGSGEAYQLANPAAAPAAAAAAPAAAPAAGPG